jgi:4-hydroxy-tetrahydrodipicolinate reductase
LAREPLGLTIGDDAGALFAESDVIIDFSAPDVAEHHARLAADTGTALVLGTTGVSMRQEAWLPETTRSAAIVWAPNMSLGVTALLSLVERLAAQLDAAAFDIEIIEMHHHHKVDAPSGTALGLAEAAARGRGVELESVWRKSRDGRTGPRPVGEIGISAVRGGDVVGDHTVIFAADGERIEITHRATSRQIFARGAVRAALWVFGRPPGLYTMQEVLDL